MKHFGTDIIRGIDLYQSEGARQFCFPSHTVLSLLRGEMRVRAGEKIFSFAGSGIILIPSGRKTDLFCEQSAVFLLIRISPAFLMEAFTRDRLLTEVISSHELPELLTLVPDLAALVPLFLESAELNRLAVNRLLFTFLERLDHTLGADAPSPDHTVSALQSRQKTVDSYITANIEKQLSLQETAAACGLTPQYLSSFFHKSMNCTFMEYINRIKAEKAREWLLASDLSPEDVCDAAGFKTYSAFCKSIEACYGSSWQQLQKEHVPSFAGLPAEDIIREPAAPLCAVPQILPDEENSAEPLLRLQKENIDAKTNPDRLLPDSWRTILNIGSANAVLFDPFQRQLNDLNRMVSFRYCRMYSLMQLVTVYVSADKTYYGFELLFQILDSITAAGLIPFLDLGYRDIPGQRNPVSTFAFDADPIDVYYEKLLLILPEFLRAASNRYGRSAVENWALEFHFSYQNNRNYTFWQFLSSFRKIEIAARRILPGIRIGGLGFDCALHPGSLQSMLEQLQSLGCQMDFISIHVNGLILPKINGSGNYQYTADENETDRRVSLAAGLTRRYYPSQPIYITEFGFAHFLNSALNDSLFQASFILRFLIANCPKVQGIGYHMLGDLGEPYRPADREFFGSPGLISTHGLRKPSWYAFSFFSKLGPAVLSAGSSFIVTALSRYSYRILAFHYRHITKPLDQLHEAKDVLAFEEQCAGGGERLQLHFRVKDAIPGQYLVKSLRMKAGGGNLHRLWLREPGSLNFLDDASYVFFREYSLPDVDAETCIVPASGELTADLLLAPMETVLLIIDRNTL